MARQIETLADLQEYVRALQANSLHHASEMLGVFPNVLVAAIGRMDTGTLRVMEKSGNTANAAWCEFNGKRFFFSFDHQGAVQAKADNMQGSVVERFCNGDSFEDISRRLAALGRAAV